ncbi:MAG TPA: hypothetical protein DCZ95_02880 [Verrucomicrobia bacterium]|nr:MAG: hypothetical protein A2X46_13205 [Lentisphaerae bacterium GWF2_57_35]HBA83017.1 hypothetical protein [Verrucomicrobiota bacterium]
MPDCGVIGGGMNNSIHASGKAFIGDGARNVIQSGAQWAVIVGGDLNVIEAGSAAYSAIVGGGGHTIGYAGRYSTIAGGYQNRINTSYACIPNGYQSSVTGTYGFAAGMFAHADDVGSFVWGDSQNTTVHSWGNDTVTFRCNGGVKFQNAAVAQYAQWIPGSASWTIVSDRNLKENIQPVDAVSAGRTSGPTAPGQMELQGVWPAAHRPDGARLSSRLCLERQPKAIDSGELQGVTLAAVQGLYQMVKDLQTENQLMRDENRQLHQRQQP